MKKVAPASVEQYLAQQPAPVRAVLQRLREVLRKAMPDADEQIAYQMPSFKLHGKPVLYFAAWKEHYALYPGSGSIVAMFADELAAYDVDKGTIRFAYDARMPVRLLTRIAKFRAQQVAERALAKKSMKKVAARQKAAKKPAKKLAKRA